MTKLSRGAVVVRGLNALRAFHGHVWFCETCKPLMDKATGTDAELRYRELKKSLCRTGRETLKAAFKATTHELFTGALSESSNGRNSHPQSTPSGEVSDT